MTEPTFDPAAYTQAKKSGPDGALLLTGALGLCVAGFTLLAVLDRAALRRATGDAEAITRSLLEYAEGVAHAGTGTPLPYPTAGTPYPAAPAARVNGHAPAAAAAASEGDTADDRDSGAPADS